LKLSAVDDLEGSFVVVMKDVLKGNEKKVYESLWKTRTFGRTVTEVAEKAKSPLLRECVAAVISREAESLARGKDSWLAKLKDLPALPNALDALKSATFFEPRARVRLRQAAVALGDRALVERVDQKFFIVG
jgi:hypothetical protein